MTLNAGSASSATLDVDEPDGYEYAGVVGFVSSEWHIAPSKITRLESGAISVNIVNSGSSQYSATFTCSVLFLPAM